jgi:hypothetical protein
MSSVPLRYPLILFPRFLYPLPPIPHSLSLCFQLLTNAQFATPLFSNHYKLPGGCTPPRSKKEETMNPPNYGNGAPK